MHVAPLSWDCNAWYWYGHGENTCATPVPTADEAKAQAVAYYKAVRSYKAEKAKP